MVNFDEFEEAYFERFPTDEEAKLVRSEDGNGNPLVILNGSIVIDTGESGIAFSPSADRHPFVGVHEFEFVQQFFSDRPVFLSHANAFNRETGGIIVGNDQVLEYLEQSVEEPAKENESSIVTGSNKLVDAQGREL